MRDRWKYILLILIGIFILSGCAKKEDVPEYTIDSRVNYFITVPYNEENWFSLSFYRLFNGNDDYSEVLDAYNNTFNVGEDAVLIGDNVEALNGATIRVTQMDFEQGETFCHNLAFLYNKKYGIVDTDLDNLEELESKVEDCVYKYSANAKILGMSISYLGNITDNVRIEQLQIPSLNITYDFQNFEIDTIKVPEGIVVNEEIAIDHKIAGGVFAGATAGGSGTKFIEGKALTGIKSLIVSSANHYYYMADESLERSFKEGDEINLEYNYYINENLIDCEQSDALAASMITKIMTENGVEIWEFEHQASVVTGSFLLKTLVFEELADLAIE
ncbi:MAG: hypothetical protein IJV71_11830 [Lachnospiraceae bacterium]|nr:hypothetical protein [Lachnospiraceae bacterium]